jgi:hypothetical protein
VIAPQSPGAPEILGERARHWTAHRYDEETRTLLVVCESDAWATTLRLTARQIVDEVNAALGAGSLEAIKVANGVAGLQRQTTTSAEATPAPARPWVTGAEPNQIFRAARDQVREQNAARGAETQSPRVEPYTLREPEDAHPEARSLQADIEEQARCRADPRARALARARQERTERAAGRDLER